MEQLYVTDRNQWRKWLSENHATKAGIWLVFYKKGTSRQTIDYEAAVEEAICFGWIDSIIKKIDVARQTDVIRVVPFAQGVAYRGLAQHEASMSLGELGIGGSELL